MLTTPRMAAKTNALANRVSSGHGRKSETGGEHASLRKADKKQPSTQVKEARDYSVPTSKAQTQHGQP